MNRLNSIRSTGMKLGKSKYRQFSDEKLMERICVGDTSAFDELYERYNKRLLYYFYRMLGRSKEKSQDFVQELFIKIIERPDLFDKKAKLSTWLFSVAHNMCKNEYRWLEVRKNEIAELDPDNYFNPVTPIEKMDLQNFNSRLLEELDKLSPEERSTFLLRYKENMATPEIASSLNCPEGTVRSRLCNISKKLAKKLTAFNPMML